MSEDLLRESARLYFDGSSLGQGRRGGAGPSAGAALLVLATGEEFETTIYLAKGHSDEAEFLGLIEGLKLARSKSASGLLIHGDSRNVIDALTGLKKLRKSALVVLQEEAEALLAGFAQHRFLRIPRRRNERADALARGRLLAGPITTEV